MHALPLFRLLLHAAGVLAVLDVWDFFGMFSMSLHASQELKLMTVLGHTPRQMTTPATARKL